MPMLLEAFDILPPLPEPEGPSPDWLDGHAAGLAQGLAQGAAEAEARSDHLTGELAQSLQDMAFGYAEAREQVLASLKPLFAALADRLLPQAAAEALGPWIAQALSDAAQSDSAAPIVVELHPDRVEAVRACLPPGSPATLRPDASLDRSAARITTPLGESDLDLGACLAAMQEALFALSDANTGMIRHG